MTRGRGSVLILTLFVLTVLSLLALSLTYRTGLETRSARHEAIGVKLRALSHSAVAAALAELAADTNDFDHPAEPWHSHPPLASFASLPELSAATGTPADADGAEYEVAYRVVDEERKLHLLQASSADLETLGLTRPAIDALLDWMDADATARAEGAEDEFYRSLATPYRAKNAAIEVMEELLLLRGVTQEVYWGGGADTGAIDPIDGEFQERPAGLVQLLRVAGDAKVNINTASPPVLRALGISEQGVDQIVGYRAFDGDSRGSLEDHAFLSLQDIERLQGLSDTDRDILADWCKFASNFYRVTVDSRHRPSGLRHRVRLLVHVGDQGPEIIQWQ